MTAPSASTVSRWTTPADIESKVRRRWDDGSLLRDYASDGPFPVIEVPIRGPQPSTIGDDVSAVREWVARLDAGRRDDRRYALQWQAVGGRHFGRNQLPSRAVVNSYDQAWSLLGVREAVSRFDEVLRAADSAPAVRDWVIGQPHRALQLHDDLPQLLAAYEWLDAHRGSGRYLREISAPGVDTKFAERHRTVLAAMLGVPSTSGGFLAGLGLHAKPDYVRLRPSASLALTPGMSELALRAGELAGLSIRPRTAFVVENEITYLAVEVPDDGVVLWGKGFDVDRVGRLPWLADVEVVYWGDIDTHGFAILDRLRAWLPQTRSVLMDRATLLAHRDRWVEEDRPTRAALSRLTEDERGLYEDLVTDAFGQRVRLEQEVVDWGWVGARSHGRNRGGFTP